MRGWVSPLVKLMIFLVITFLLTYVLAVTIANTDFGATYSYTARFTDVTGLNQGDDVRIAGVRVGTVDSIKIVKVADEKTNTLDTSCWKGTSVAQVSFTVQKATRLPADVGAVVRYRNLVGQRYIDVQRPSGGGANRLLRPGGTISLCHTAPAVDLTVLFQGFRPLVAGLDAGQINQLSGEIIQTLQGEGGALQTLLANLADLTNSLADKDQVIGEVVDNLSSVLGTVAQHDTQLNDLIVQLKNFISGLAQDRVTIGNSIDGINDLATSTSGLLTQLRPPLRKDVTDLTGLLGTLDKSKGSIQYVIQQLPPTVASLIRTASYGSWYNFYLCSLSGVPGTGSTLTLGGAKLPLTLNLPASGTARCS